MLSSQPLQRVNTRSITSVTSEIRSLGHVSSSRLYADGTSPSVSSSFHRPCSCTRTLPGERENRPPTWFYDRIAFVGLSRAHPPSPRGCSDGLSIRFGAAASMRSFWSSNSQIPSWNVSLTSLIVGHPKSERGALSTPSASMLASPQTLFSTPCKSHRPSWNVSLTSSIVGHPKSAIYPRNW